MSFVYTPAKTKLAKADADFDTLDVRVILVMSDTTADTDQDAATIAAITTLDEYDGSGYAEIDGANLTVAEDAPNNRAEITIDAGNFGTTVGVGTRQAVGAVAYAFVDGTPGNDWPIAFIDSGGFPFDGNGGQINFTPNAEGLLQVT
jgi:hypothetical protein